MIAQKGPLAIIFADHPPSMRVDVSFMTTLLPPALLVAPFSDFKFHTLFLLTTHSQVIWLFWRFFVSEFRSIFVFIELDPFS